MTLLTSKVVQPEAYIAIGRNRQKIYSDNQVYLKDGTEFSIELFNPTQRTVAARIHLNGEQISNRLIIVKPGQRVYLERYIDDDKKLKFDTYNVDDSDESKNAIACNGSIKVEFFKESTNNTNGPITVTNPWTPNPFPSNPWAPIIPGRWDTINPVYYYSNTNAANGTSSDIKFNCSNNLSGNIETGRVERGSDSDQKFDDYYGTFEFLSAWQTEYKILPESMKPVEINKIRQYCGGCGTRIRKSSWQWCPNCGNKL